MQYALVTTMVVGLVELVTALFDRNFRTAVIISGSAIIGGVCGASGVEALDIPTGIAVGLAASGLVTVAKKV